MRLHWEKCEWNKQDAKTKYEKKYRIALSFSVMFLYSLNNFRLHLQRCEKAPCAGNVALAQRAATSHMLCCLLLFVYSMEQNKIFLFLFTLILFFYLSLSSFCVRGADCILHRRSHNSSPCFTACATAAWQPKHWSRSSFRILSIVDAFACARRVCAT